MATNWYKTGFDEGCSEGAEYLPPITLPGRKKSDYADYHRGWNDARKLHRFTSSYGEVAA